MPFLLIAYTLFIDSTHIMASITNSLPPASLLLHGLLRLIFIFIIQQVSRSEGESGSVEQSQHHLLTLTHLVPWHYATILLSGTHTMYNVLIILDVQGQLFTWRPTIQLL